MKKIIFIAIITFLAFNISAQVKWYSFEEAVKLNENEPRKFMIDVYTDWCGWCKVMDKNTFNNEIISRYLNENYYPVKLNAEQRDSINFKDQTYKYVASGNRGVHEFAYALLSGNMSYPSVVFLDENYNGLTVEKGYIKAHRFDMIIKFIGEEHYKSNTWEKWSTEYNSPIPAE